ncbi:MAG: signal peptidase I [Oligoflexia bacterium]|nr:signal peptidase I [Oligoflexia bacterium]
MKTFALGFLTAGILLLINDFFFFESILVPSSSMRPTIEPNERIFILKNAKTKPPQRFDIVVASSRKLGHRIIKRVVGVPGDCIELIDSWQVSINGQTLAYPGRPSSEGAILVAEENRHLIRLRREEGEAPETVYGKEPLCLQPDEYYLLGDNRLTSSDSRTIGPIPIEEIDGKALVIWYSYDRKEGRLRMDRVMKKLL